MEQQIAWTNSQMGFPCPTFYNQRLQLVLNFLTVYLDNDDL